MSVHVVCIGYIYVRIYGGQHWPAGAIVMESCIVY